MMLGISISANATFRIENLGDLGGNDSSARALNNQGDVVGDSLNKNGNFDAFLHQTETGIESLELQVEPKASL